MDVAHEIYLCVDTLLCDDIPRRRSSLFQNISNGNGKYSFVLDFFYNLVLVLWLCVKFVLVIVFSNLKKMIQYNKKYLSGVRIFCQG